MRRWSTPARALRRDDSVRVVIVTGAGTAFCAGGNVKDMRTAPASSPAARREIARELPPRHPAHPARAVRARRAGDRRRQRPGHRRGLDLACMCDIRIASETRALRRELRQGRHRARRRRRLAAAARGRHVAGAAEMAFTGDTIDAAEALACGLVSRVVPPDELLDAARELAARIAANPPPGAAPDQAAAARRPAHAAVHAAGTVGRLPGAGARHRRPPRGGERSGEARADFEGR